MMNSKTVDQLFSKDGEKYRIPIYQRHYVWTQNNWEHLWDDIRERCELKLRSEKLPHFTGVIVVRRETGTMEIVDGQQRLTTFQIILCAIRDLCEEAGYNEAANAAANRIRNRGRNEANPIEQYKLLPRATSDLNAFGYLAAGNPEQSNGRIRDAYVYFKRKIKGHVTGDQKRMIHLLTTFLADFSVVQLLLKADDEASKIFESLNGRGIALAQFDHLRNNVFLRAGSARNDLYNRYWNHFNTEPYWFSDEVADKFLLSFLKAKLGEDFDSQSSPFDLYQRIYLKKLWKSRKKDETDDDLVEREFRELERYSRVYAEVTDCDQKNSLWFYKFLATEFGITSWHPLILFLKSEKAELGISDKDLELIFRTLESYIVWCILCYGPKSISGEKSPVMGENGLISIIREKNSFHVRDIVTHLTDFSEYKWPTGKKVTKVLGQAGEKKRRFIRYILFQIEHKLTDFNFTDVKINFEEWLNIEHVMPQNWNQANWPLRTDSEKHVQVIARNKCLQSIGNLTLLKETLNRAVGNRSFSVKQKLYGRHSRLSLTRDILEHNKWDVEEIRQRETELVKLFYEIWPSAGDILREVNGGDTESTPDVIPRIKTSLTGESSQYRDKRYRGQLKDWQPNFAYGFIESDEFKNDIYVPRGEFRSEDLNLLQRGQSVTFNLIETDKGPQAHKVKLVQD